ncbi:MAG: NADH/Ubiquinone/plastoquinone, partial [Acidobacteria bacterium]|nr:NADH/Ubiquinone/plastoquinone [Acidobacteriota bacterium]
MSLALVLLPAAAGVLAFVLRSYPARRALLILAALGHALLVGACWLPGKIPPVGDRWLAIDPLGLIFLSIASLLFLAASAYAVGYLAREAHGRRPDFEESGVFFANVPEAIFIGGLLLFLATLSLAALSQHFGLLWVGMEATTLATAPLIYFHRHHRSLEAAWKYLLICSVGIGIALLGNFVLAVAAEAPQGEPIPLVVGALAARAGEMDRLWLRAAFLFFIVGYGTKMGLAPLHTWLPDAHSECPSVVSALLSGALLNVALLGILRAQQVLVAAGEGAFGRSLLLGFGVLSVFVAAVFVLGQPDYKRLLAYSSVEHVGILALGVGLGPWGAFPALYHAINHSLAKAMLFFVSGNILAAYRTKEAAG